MASFVPAPDSLSQVLNLFENLHAADNTRHKEIYDKLNVFQQHPEFNNYLAFILGSGSRFPEPIRSQAGITLKNNILDGYEEMQPQVQAYVKSQVFATIGDASKFLRGVVGTIITTIAWKEALKGWGSHLQQLVGLLDNKQISLVEGAFDALSKICEDMPQMLDSEEIGRPLNYMIPKFITFFLHPQEIIRRYALESVNCFLTTQPQAMIVNMNTYLEALCKLTQDSAPEIRKRVCQGFVGVVISNYGALSRVMPNVMQFILVVCQDKDEEVAQEACEFWPAFCHTEHSDRGLLKNALPHLIPVLLKCMRYSAEEVAALEADQDDDKPDDPSAIKPRLHKSKGLGDDEEEDEGEVTQWNLRKCAASSLDTLADLFKEELWPLFQPLLQRCLESSEWLVRESGLLALGAVAEGCYMAIQPHLEKLVPYMIGLLKDLPLVRSISAWTLSRYAAWILDSPDEVYLQPFLAGLFDCMLHRNKRVQEASCSAFATLEDEAQDRLIPYLGLIVKTMIPAFNRYQAKNLLILYDALGTLAEAVGPALNEPQYLEALMPPFFKRWQDVRDDDRSLFAIFECLAALAGALKEGFMPYAPPVVNRCLHIIGRVLFQYHQAVQAGEAEYFADKEFIEGALDLLAAMTDAVKGRIEVLLGPTNASVLLHQCLHDVLPNVRQSAFSFLGLLARARWGPIREHVDKYVVAAANNLDPLYPSLCNNASWSIGEITTFIGGDTIKPFVQNILHRLIPVVLQNDLHPGLLENTSITLGRLVGACPREAASQFPGFAKVWSYRISQIRDPGMKEQTFGALCALLQVDPRPALAAVPQICVIALNWHQPSPALNNQFRTVISGLKQLAGENWGRLVHPDHRKPLHDRFGL